MRLDGSVTLLPDADDMGCEARSFGDHLHGEAVHAVKIRHKSDLSKGK